MLTWRSIRDDELTIEVLLHQDPSVLLGARKIEASPAHLIIPVAL